MLSHDLRALVSHPRNDTVRAREHASVHRQLRLCALARPSNDNGEVARCGGVPGRVVKTDWRLQNVGGLTAHQQSYPSQIRDLPSNHSTMPFRSLTLTNLTVRLLVHACRVYSGCTVEQPDEVDSLEGVDISRTWFGLASWFWE